MQPIDSHGRGHAAFVLMPFEKQFELLFERVLQPALEAAGMHVLRADSVLDQHSVMRDVVEGIANATLIVADITQVNANVYYELGLAHALLKPTVLLTQDISKVPFDLKGYRVIAYSTLFHEVDHLRAKLEEIARGHLVGSVRFGNPVTDYLDAAQLAAIRSADTRFESTAPSGSNEPGHRSQDESGFLDWMADLEEADERIGNQLTEVADATEHVGEQMTTQSEQITALAATSQISPKNARALARDAAADLSAYGDVLQRIVPEFIEEADRFVDAGLNLAEWFRELDADHSEGRREFRSSVEQLLRALLEGRAGLEEYRAVIGGLRGITNELSRASAHVAARLDEMFEAIDKIVAFCERTLSIVPVAANEPQEH